MIQNPFVGDFLDIESLLDRDETEILRALRQTLAGIDQEIIDRSWAEASFPHSLVSVLADAGCMSAHFDSVLHPDRPVSSYLLRGLLTAELARKDASLATFAGVSGSLFGLTLLHFGTDAHRELLASIATGEVVGSFGLTEPGSGSDIAGGVKTTARRDGDAWVLNGAKRWIGNATWADYIVVWAREQQPDRPNEANDTRAGKPKFLGFVVPADAAGVTTSKIEDKFSLRTVQNADIRLEEVRVPDSARLPGVSSFRQIAEVLKYTRVEVGWAAIGNALGALDAAVEHSVSHHQFGKPIGSFQLIQDLLVRAQTAIISATAALAQAAWLSDQGRLLDEHASVVKLIAASNARTAVAACREVLGGNGILLEHRVVRHFMDAEAILTFEGTHQVNTLIIGRAMTGLSAFG